MKQFSLEWDTDYGIDRRSGWSVVINGSVLAELERFMLVALAKAFYRYWGILRDPMR